MDQFLVMVLVLGMTCTFPASVSKLNPTPTLAEHINHQKHIPVVMNGQKHSWQEVTILRRLKLKCFTDTKAEKCDCDV